MKILCMCIFNKCNINTENKIFKNIYFKYFKTTSKVVSIKRYSAIVIRLWNNISTLAKCGDIWSRIHSLPLLSVVNTIKYEWISQQIQFIFETALWYKLGDFSSYCKISLSQNISCCYLLKVIQHFWMEKCGREYGCDNKFGGCEGSPIGRGFSLRWQWRLARIWQHCFTIVHPTRDTLHSDFCLIE